MAKALLLDGQELLGRAVRFKRSDRRVPEDAAEKKPDPAPRQPRDPEAAKRSVFVGNLSYDAKAEHLGELFAVAGTVAEVRMAKDKKTGKAKGFAVVEFTEPGAVAK